MVTAVLSWAQYCCGVKLSIHHHLRPKLRTFEPTLQVFMQQTATIYLYVFLHIVKISISNFTQSCPVGAELFHGYRQTDGQTSTNDELISCFCYSEKAPKIDYVLLYRKQFISDIRITTFGTSRK
jgi:hypothetical protein